MSKTKFVSIGLVIVVASFVLLFACGEKEEVPKVVNKTNAPEVLIDFWDFEREANTASWMVQAFRKFEEQHPGVKIKYSKKNYGKSEEDLDRLALTGNPPDIVGNGLKYFYVEQEYLEPLSSYLSDMDKADFHDAALNSCRYGGEIWALPWYTTAYVMFVNNAILKENGIEPPVNGRWDYDDFLKKMRKLGADKNNDGAPDYYSIGYNVGVGSFEIWGFIYTEGARILDRFAESCIINSAEGVEGIMKLLDMQFNYGIVVPDPTKRKAQEIWDAFVLNQNIGVTCQPSYYVTILEDYNARLQNRNEELKKKDKKAIPSPLFDYSVAVFPMGNKGLIQLASAGVGNFMLFKQDDDYKREKCVMLMKFLVNAKNQREALPLSGVSPSRRSAGKIYSVDSVLAPVQDVIPLAITPPLHPDWKRIDSIINSQLKKLLAGKPSTEQGIGSAYTLDEVREDLAYAEIKVKMLLEKRQKKEMEKKVQAIE